MFPFLKNAMKRGRGGKEEHNEEEEEEEEMMNRRGGGEDEEEGAEGGEDLYSPFSSFLPSSSNLFLPSRVVSFELILLSFFL